MMNGVLSLDAGLGEKKMAHVLCYWRGQSQADLKRYPGTAMLTIFHGDTTPEAGVDWETRLSRTDELSY